MKWFRRAVALMVLLALTALFVDFAQIVPRGLHWLAHLQMTPAVLDFAGKGLLIAGLWVGITLLFGRVYCSFMCPLGILQDVFSRGKKIIRGKKAAYGYRPEMRKTRLALLAVFLVSLALVPVGVTVLDPYSNFGRIMTSLAKPVWQAGNNVLAKYVGAVGGLRFDYQLVYVDYPAIAAALVAFILIGVLAFFFGRRYCNTLCPVGTLLGLLARFSLFKIRLKPGCVSCGQCEKACKGECIDSKSKTVDASRCVACMNCLGVCRWDYVTYSPQLVTLASEAKTPPETVSVSAEEEPAGARRTFLQWSTFSVLLAAGPGRWRWGRSADPPPDPSLPTGVSEVEYEITAPVLPPGAGNVRHFQRHCTGCQLCVSKCPANILHPSTTELGWNGFMQPTVKFQRKFCNYDCTICTEVCPTHALQPLTVDEKHRLQIGKVVFLKRNCVVHSQHTNCGACAEHCPTGAVKMVPFGNPARALTIPETDPELCVGCGACENICPVRPFRAIYVDGLQEQGTAKLGYDPEAKQETVELNDFGF